MKKNTAIDQIWNTFFIVLSFIGFQSIFTMDPIEVNKGILLSPDDMVLNLVLLHTYPTAFNHSEVCALALVDKRCLSYVLEKAMLVRGCVNTPSMSFFGHGNIQRLWHKFGSAFYLTDAQLPNTLRMMYRELDEWRSKMWDFSITTEEEINNVRPFIDRDGIYRYHVSFKSNNGHQIIAYGLDGSKRQCFGRMMNEQGNFTKFNLAKLISAPDCLKYILQESSVQEELSPRRKFPIGHLVYSVDNASISADTKSMINKCL